MVGGGASVVGEVSSVVGGGGVGSQVHASTEKNINSYYAL